jgi:hypothetical protein
MNLINIQYVLLDSFSGAYDKRTTQRDMDTYNKMKQGVGSCFREFTNGIAWDWQVVSVSQCDENNNPIETTEL